MTDFAGGFFFWETAIYGIFKAGNRDGHHQKTLSFPDHGEKSEVEAWLVLAREAHEQEDYETSFRYYEQAAKAGSAEGQFMTAASYYYGMGTEQSYEKAAEYYQLSADQNDPDGLECLGYLYLEGLGVEQSRDRATELYRLAAALGSEEAQQQLAILGD